MLDEKASVVLSPKMNSIQHKKLHLETYWMSMLSQVSDEVFWSSRSEWILLSCTSSSSIFARHLPGDSVEGGVLRGEW
jgi:hypothetical protein